MKTQYNRIKGALADSGKKNKELAEFMGVTEGTVSDWCGNRNQPSIPDLFLIARFLKLEPGELLNKKGKASV